MASGKIFAIGDIHGCNKELNELLAKLPLEADSKIVFLGDYVDRGPDSKGVIETILALKEQYDVVTLMGNHESMMIEFFNDPSSTLAGFFVLNGGSATLASYVTQGNEYEIPKEHFDFLHSLKLYHETENHIFVHAGLPNKKINKINWQEHKTEVLWIRYPFLNSQFNWGKTVVHGHTPSLIVEITPNRINLDTGCVFSQHLTAMEINSQTVYQVKARENIPKTFLISDPRLSRAAKRFAGLIPVFVETPDGYDEYQTLNYNEFGLLILQVDGGERLLEVGQILKGKIGPLDRDQVKFVGQVVRHQERGEEIAYGVKMIEPLILI